MASKLSQLFADFLRWRNGPESLVSLTMEISSSDLPGEHPSRE